MSLCTEISDVATHATQIGSRLINQASSATRLAGLWHGLALKTHESESCENLQQPLDEAQALVRLAPGLRNSKFLNPTAEVLPKILPDLPKTVWVSALYHVYLALAEIARPSNLGIVTRPRAEPDKTLLVIQVATQPGTEVPRRSEKQAYHLDIARAILTPFHVTLAVLPALEGPYPVVISWNHNRANSGRSSSAQLLTRNEQAPGETKALPSAQS